MRIIECFSLVCCQFSGQEYRGAHMWGSREKAQQFFGRKMSWLLIKTTTTLFSHVSRGRWRQRQLATSLPSFLLLCLQTRESSSRRNFPFSKCSLKIHGKERTFWFHFFFALWVYRTFFKAIMLHALRRKSIIITMKTVCRKAPYCVCYVLSMLG